jgi:hypothetical protein
MEQVRACFATSLAWAVAGLFMAGCSFQARPNPASGDGGVEGVDGGGVLMACAWAAHFDACELPGTPPAQALMLNSPTKWTFTTAGMGGFGPVTPAGGFVIRKLSQTGGGRDVLVLYTSAFTLGAGATLDITGDKALVIAADTTIKIDGTLDAGSHTVSSGPPVVGPGANDIGCTGNLNGGGSGSGGSGGGGGALAANGGPGGDGDNGGTGGGAGVQVALPAFVRAGCAGGTGGGSTRTNGNGGNGGGTIELAARGAITVTGRINAGGAGGEGGAKLQGGGGGGGSGGIISFHAPTVTFTSTAVIVANGGAGGSGGSDEDSGHAGDDGLLAAASARGGDPASESAGGDGGTVGKPDGSPGTDGSKSGGGGGGSTGYVMVRAGSFSPAGVGSPPASRL